MAIQERVTAYSVSTLRNDLVGYRRVIRLTTETGHQAFLAFPAQPPPDWLTVSGPTSTAFLERDEFDRLYHVCNQRRRSSTPPSTCSGSVH
jgi:hypothetical protein